MTYARSAFYRFKEVNFPIIPEHNGCNNPTFRVFYGEQHVYAFCLVCNGKFALLSNDSWEILPKDKQWVGPAEHGSSE